MAHVAAVCSAVKARLALVEPGGSLRCWGCCGGCAARWGGLAGGAPLGTHLRAETAAVGLLPTRRQCSAGQLARADRDAPERGECWPSRGSRTGAPRFALGLWAGRSAWPACWACGALVRAWVLWVLHSAVPAARVGHYAQRHDQRDGDSCRREHGDSGPPERCGCRGAGVARLAVGAHRGRR